MNLSNTKHFLRNLPIIRQFLHQQIKLDQVQEDLAVLRSLLTQDIQERRKTNASKGNPHSLHPFEQSVYSQNGEDGVIQEIFRRIGAPAKTFVELGVGDGWENNTLFLHTQGWQGWWIDADPAFVSELVNELPPDSQRALRHEVAEVTAENVVPLLTGLGAPHEPDLLSLDLDQNTYYIWQALEAYRARLIVVEYNSAVPASVDWKVHYDAGKPWDGSLNVGASLKALEKLGKELDYRLVHCEAAGANAFFVRNDLVAEHFKEPATAEYHYEPFRFLLPRDCHPSNRRILLDRNTQTES